MFDFGHCRDDNSQLDLHGYSPANTGLFDFSRALHEFLCRNQIDFVGPFQMRLEGTSGDNWRLLIIEGSTSTSELNASHQVGWGLASPFIPSSSNNLSAYETAQARNSGTLASSSVHLTIF